MLAHKLFQKKFDQKRKHFEKNACSQTFSKKV
jgi:hypothetical protein